MIGGNFCNSSFLGGFVMVCVGVLRLYCVVVVCGSDFVLFGDGGHGGGVAVGGGGGRSGEDGGGVALL